MNSKVEKWADRLQKEELLEFAIKYLQKNNVALPADNRRRAVVGMPRREQLVEMAHGLLRGSEADKRLYERLLASVRQERAGRVRAKEERVIKRLDLKQSTCSKLASIARATRRNESSLVEDLIADEALARRRESATLKDQRRKIAEDLRELREQRNELEQAGVELSRREQRLAESLGRLAAFEKLLKTLMECGVEGLQFKINVDQRNSIDGLMEFSSAYSPDIVKPLEDALNEVLDRFGRSGRNS